MTADGLLTAIVVLIDIALAIAAVRLTWWVFKTFVRGTGKAWRGE